MTTIFRRGLLGGPNNARFDQDLCKIIGIANIKSTTNIKEEAEVSRIPNCITEPLPLLTSPSRTERASCSSTTTIKMEDNNLKKSPSFVKKSYPEFARMINQTLALEKHKSFKNESYAKEIKKNSSSLYGQRLMDAQHEESVSSEKSLKNLSPDLSPPFSPKITSPSYNKENDLHHNKLETISKSKYKSTSEFLKKTLGTCSSSQTSAEAILSPYERLNFDQHIPRISSSDCHIVQGHCCEEHIKHPVSKLPYPKEYLDLLNSGDNHNTSSMLCLPHPAAKYLDGHLMRPFNSVSHNTFGTQNCLELQNIDGCGDRLQHFALPPKEPSPEFQHYPFQLF